MGEGNSIINLGDLSKPATVLIEKISEAIGGYFKPYQTKRVAKADAEAERIKAVSKIEITELQQRALNRFIAEEAKKQHNIEAIANQALQQLEDNSKPEEMEEDWIMHFFDKCRLVSDKEMQTLWARVLAGEANLPGTYSKRTINVLSSLDKQDAILFTKLCGFNWTIDDIVPLIYDDLVDIYNEHDIGFDSLKHLDDIGLISFDAFGYKKTELSKHITVFYQKTLLNIEFRKDKDELDIGKVLLTRVGQELARICNPDPVDGFFEYIIERWSKNDLILSSPYPIND